MTQYIKDKNGKFAGSIGNGYQAPQSAPFQPVVEASPSPTVYRGIQSFAWCPSVPNSETWDAAPTTAIRLMYRSLGPRIQRLSECSVEERQELAVEDGSYDWLVVEAAERCLQAQAEGKKNLARLWGYAMEWTSLARTSTWDEESRPRVDVIADRLVEFVIREEAIEDFVSHGYDRPFAEEMEVWHRRSGGRNSHR